MRACAKSSTPFFALGGQLFFAAFISVFTVRLRARCEALATRDPIKIKNKKFQNEIDNTTGAQTTSMQQRECASHYYLRATRKKNRKHEEKSRTTPATSVQRQTHAVHARKSKKRPLIFSDRKSVPYTQHFVYTQQFVCNTRAAHFIPSIIFVFIFCFLSSLSFMFFFLLYSPSLFLFLFLRSICRFYFFIRTHAYVYKRQTERPHLKSLLTRRNQVFGGKDIGLGHQKDEGGGLSPDITVGRRQHPTR